MSVETIQQRSVIFFSYSHRDKQWLNEFQLMLSPISRDNRIRTWADTDIQPGDKWRQEIEDSLKAAKVAVLLVSRNFLASDFIHKYELPSLLESAESEGLTVLWVYVSACMYRQTPIADFQAAHDLSKPLDMLSTPKRRHVIVEICEEILAAYQRGARLGEGLFRQATAEQLPKAVRQSRD